jgi:hypothetical protein
MLNHVLLPVTHSVTYPAMQMRLNKLLAERVKPGTDKQAIDDQIWELFGEEWAVMFTDLAQHRSLWHHALSAGDL